MWADHWEFSRPKARRRFAVAASVGLTILTAPLAAWAGPTDLFYERTLVATAGARCDLFTAPMVSALNAAAQQARGAALRTGVTVEALDAAESRAKARARTEPCASDDLALVAERANDAFKAYERLQRLRYPGDIHDWNASRGRSATGRTWNLSQQASVSPDRRDRLTFGLTAKGGDQIELIGVVRFADGATPYAARLVTRDPAKARQPYLDTRAATDDGELPLGARVAPRSATRTFWAQARFEPDQLIRPSGTAPSTAYRFPIEAMEIMTRLDPREAVEVEFLFSGRDGDTIRRAYIEVGDFAAGKAFMWVAQR